MILQPQSKLHFKVSVREFKVIKGVILPGTVKSWALTVVVKPKPAILLLVSTTSVDKSRSNAYILGMKVAINKC